MSDMNEAERPWRDADWLQREYVEHRKSTYDIADEQGCSPSTVSNWLARHGIAGCGRGEGVECPTCGGVFDSDQGMKTHHAMVHGESIAGTLVVCEWCGSEFRKPTNYEAERTENHFCDQGCYGEWRSDTLVGEENPASNSVEVECASCGAMFRRSESDAGLNKKDFCDRSCYGAYQSEDQKGEDNPFWSGGYEGYYGPSWYEARRQALSRAGYECERCGLSRDEHRELHDRDLNVHHKTPFSEFGSENHADANSLDNLMAVCGPCHREVEEGGNGGAA